MLPSVAVMVTCVAFTAVTVKVDELPDIIDPGLAVIFTVGLGFGVTVTVVTAEVFPPIPEAIAV